MTDRAPLPAVPDRCPPLPDDALAVLDAGLDAIGLRVVLPQGARATLEGHLRLLLAWTAAVNLTGVRDPVAAVTAHIVDSLAALPFLRALGADQLLDLGSGGGYPGLALAVALPARRALLVELVGKKARFLETAAAGLGLADRVDVAAWRAEDLAADRDHREAWPVVTARAVAPLAELVELAFPLLVPGGILVAWKSGALDDERRRAEPALAALGGGHLEIIPADGLGTLEGHVLVVATKHGPTEPGWPRSPAQRRRRPW